MEEVLEVLMLLNDMTLLLCSGMLIGPTQALSHAAVCLFSPLISIIYCSLFITDPAVLYFIHERDCPFSYGSQPGKVPPSPLEPVYCGPNWTVKNVCNGLPKWISEQFRGHRKQTKYCCLHSANCCGNSFQTHAKSWIAGQINYIVLVQNVLFRLPNKVFILRNCIY